MLCGVLRPLGALVLLLGILGLSASAAPINPTAYGSLTSAALIDFESLAPGPFPGVSIDGVLVQTGASFAERFAGQTLGTSGTFDTLSGTPTGPLSLVAGAPGQNLVAADAGGIGIAGLGPLGYPDLSANGEGSIAMLFDVDTSEVGFEVRGVDAGTMTLGFYRRDGSLIDTLNFALFNGFFGFTRDGGLADIAGVTITNDDVEGVGLDNFVFQPIPEPGSGVMVVLGLLALSGRRARLTSSC